MFRGQRYDDYLKNASISAENHHLPEVPGRPAENKTAECIAMKDELGGGYKGEIKFGN